MTPPLKSPWPQPKVVLITPEDGGQCFQVSCQALMENLPATVDSVFELVQDHAFDWPITITDADEDTVRYLAAWLNHGSIIFANIRVVDSQTREQELLKVVRLFCFAELHVLPELQNAVVCYFHDSISEFDITPILAANILSDTHPRSQLREFIVERIVCGALDSSSNHETDTNVRSGAVQMHSLTEKVKSLYAPVMACMLKHAGYPKMPNKDTFLVQEQSSRVGEEKPDKMTGDFVMWHIRA